MKIENLQKETESLILTAGADFVGFADISELRIPKGSVNLCTAIAMGIAYDKNIVSRLALEVDAFEKHLRHNKEKMKHILEACSEHLKQSGFLTWVPPISHNRRGLLSDFSHKTAATKGGLGWIGRNSLFVSDAFGCGVRLGTVITDAPFEPGIPLIESLCGDCAECVEACPYGAIKGATWYPGIGRAKLIDAFLCSRKRNEYVAKLGYKHPCGLCIQACPHSR